MKAKNFFIRAASGLTFAGIVIGAVFGGIWWVGVLFFLFALLGLFEFYRLVTPSPFLRRTCVTGMSLGTLIYWALFLSLTGKADPTLLWIIPLACIMLPVLDILILNPAPAQSSFSVFTGWVYVVLPFALVGQLMNLLGWEEPAIAFGFLMVLWTNDTGAYLSGSLIGRTKLLPSVSPNKTWEGLAGGIVLSIVAALVMHSLVGEMERSDWVLMAIVLAVFANTGDLFESHLKRIAGVKDSGKLMPGHGGVLDRFDGLLISLPAFLAIYYLLHTL